MKIELLIVHIIYHKQIKWAVVYIIIIFGNIQSVLVILANAYATITYHKQMRWSVTYGC